MTTITAAMVGALRARTDAPMMECKRALTEANGDAVKAEELLRVKLGSKASKAASRITAEGVIAAHIEGQIGALIEVNCETDFVTKNDEFIAFANTCAKLIVRQNPADLAALLALPLEDKTVEGKRAELIGRIGENISIRRFQRLASSAKFSSYLHGTRIGVIVDFDGADEHVGKDVAMHIAAMKPVALSAHGVPAELIERERSVAKLKSDEDAAKARAEGKKEQSEEIVHKRIDGSVQKYLKEVSLLNQSFVKDDKHTIEQMLKAANTTVNAFVLYVVGEGIEKKQDDFAAEVAAQVASAKQG